jgi:hypothetical protein
MARYYFRRMVAQRSDRFKSGRGPAQVRHIDGAFRMTGRSLCSLMPGLNLDVLIFLREQAQSRCESGIALLVFPVWRGFGLVDEAVY